MNTQPPAKKKKKNRTFTQRLVKFFLTTVLGGVIVILPISIFLLLFRFILKLILGIIAPISNLLRFNDATTEWVADIMAMIIVTLVFFIIGLVVQTPRGKRFFSFLETTYLDRIPFYPTIKDTVQQFTGTSRTPFSQVVLADVFGNDTRMIGFITDELDNDMFSIFVPTGPNPTNGFVFQVKRSQLEFIEARPEDAMRSIVAVGAGTRKMMENARLDKEARERKAQKKLKKKLKKEIAITPPETDICTETKEPTANKHPDPAVEPLEPADHTPSPDASPVPVPTTEPADDAPVTDLQR